MTPRPAWVWIQGSALALALLDFDPDPSLSNRSLLPYGQQEELAEHLLPPRLSGCSAGGCMGLSIQSGQALVG